MLFPGCDCCSPCGCNSGTRLPYSLTVTPASLKNRTHGPHATLTFSSSFGSGAAGVLLSPGGCDANELATCGPSDRGPISSVLLTSGGSGYAQMGRKQPSLVFSAPHGSGAVFTPTLKIDDASGCPVWSITSISVTGGSGYVDGTPLTIATAGSHAMPTVNATVAGGAGGALTVTLTSNDDYPETWHVGVSVSAAGTGYTNGASVAFSTPDHVGIEAVATITTDESGAITGTTVANAGKYWKAIKDCRCNTIKSATGTIHTGTTRVQPTVTASVAGVTGATLVVSLASNGDSPQTWQVSSVSVAASGTGASVDGTVTFSTPDVEVTGATATVSLQYSNPGYEYVGSDGGGSGVVATLTLSESTGDDGHPIWSPSGISINNGGTGYAVGDYLEFRAPGYAPVDGVTGVAVYCVETVDGGGSVLTVTGPDGGFAEPFRSVDGIASVTVDSGGAYYKQNDNGAPTGVTIGEHGEYWCSDPEATPCAANVTVTAGGGGTGAVITPTIDADKTSASFGQITGLTVGNAGTNYLAWHWECGSDSQLNGIPFVLRAHDPVPLVVLSIEACFGCGATATINNLGPRVAPSLTLTPACSSDAEEGCTGYALTPTLTNHDDEYWAISSVSASGGTDCVDCTEAFVVPGCGFHQIEAAEITLTSADGALTGATVVNGGKFYSQFEWDGAPSQIHSVSLTSSGSGYAVLGRQQPSSITISSTPGTGATFLPAWNKIADECGRPCWEIYSVSVSDGSGYIDGRNLSFSVSPPVVCDDPAVGEIRASPDGTVTVEMLKGGKYYEENPAIPPLVADVTVRLIQYAGSSGSGASLAATVNSTVGDANFGKITALTLTNGGSGYSLFGGPRDCYYTGGCRLGCAPEGNVSVVARGGQPLNVTINNTHLRSTTNVTNCGSLPTSVGLWYGAEAGSALIEAGGEWNSRGTEGCGNTGCACPLDDVTDLGSTPVSFTASDAAGSGTLASVAEQNNGTWTGPIEDGGYALITLSCCDSACNSSGECVLSIGVSVSLYYVFDETPSDPLGGIATIIGAACVSTLSVNEDGELVGTASIPAVKLTLEYGEEDTTIELSFGTP